jgi:uncharacterized protein with HEPN domain
MRREELYLKDIIEAAEAIHKFLGEVKKSAFLTNDLLRSAVLQKLSVMGEAGARLPLKFRKSHPEIPWEDIFFALRAHCQGKKSVNSGLSRHMILTKGTHCRNPIV